MQMCPSEPDSFTPPHTHTTPTQTDPQPPPTPQGYILATAPYIDNFNWIMVFPMYLLAPTRESYI